MSDAVLTPTADLEPTFQGRLEGRGKVSLAFARWEPPAPAGRVVLLHGYGEHGGRYRHTASWLQSLGWAVSALDQQGFGRSGGRRGDAHGIRGFVDDFADFLRVERRHDAQRLAAPLRMLDGMPRPAAPACPQVVIGHSFGGLVAALTALWHPDALDGLILSSPAFPLRRFSRLESAILALMGVLAPHWAPRLASDKARVCSDPELVDRFWADPHCHQFISAAFVRALKEGERALRPFGSELERPTLLLEAGDDALVVPDGAEDFWRAVRPELLERHRFEGLKHELLHDLERAKVQQVIAAWLMKRFTPSC